MNKNIYQLYKQIMKRKLDAIDEIKTLEDAKLIITMITGNAYLNSLPYLIMSELEKEKENK